MAPVKALWRKVLKPFRRYLLAGIVVIAPLGVTAYVLWWIFVRLDGILGGYVQGALGVAVPGLGLVALILLLLLTGWLAERTLGGRLLAQWERLFRRLPLARRVYNASSKIVRTVLGDERYFFREVVLFEYPSEGRFAIGFVAGPAPSAAREEVGEDGVTVYMPTAPNPMSGYLAIVSRSRLTPLPITVEEAFTFVFSAGTVSVERAARVLAEARSPEEADVGTP